PEGPDLGEAGVQPVLNPRQNARTFLITAGITDAMAAGKSSRISAGKSSRRSSGKSLITAAARGRFPVSHGMNVTIGISLLAAARAQISGPDAGVSALSRQPGRGQEVKGLAHCTLLQKSVAAQLSKSRRLRKFNDCLLWGTTGVYNRKTGHACFNTFALYAFIAETPSPLGFPASPSGFIFSPSLVQPE